MKGNYWSIVDKIVRARGREVIRYKFFEEVWGKIDNGHKLIILRAPTGSGKTEATFSPFLYDLIRGERRWLSLIHVLPTRSLVNAMETRHAAAIATLGLTYVTILHDYGQLIDMRPYLDGDLVITTYDTLFYRFYGVNLSSPYVITPLSKLVNSLIIFDEAQLLQDEYWYAMSVLPYHITSLIKWGSQVILMTATLPSVFIDELTSVLKKSDFSSNDIEIVNVGQRVARGKLNVVLEDREMPESQEALLSVIREYYPGKGAILIVSNTVEKAATLYRLAMQLYVSGKLDLKPYLIHSRLRVGTRANIESMLEKNRDNDILLVATQVVEAGLDFDVTLLLTEISPIDSLIQRLGRCGRKQDGVAVIYTVSEGGLKVYPSLLIYRTQDAIKQSQDLISSSPSDLKAAQKLIDEVFSMDVIETLRSANGRVAADINEVRKWIYRNWIDMRCVESTAAHIFRSPLLRLGIELHTYLPDPSEREALLNGKRISIPLAKLSQRLVKLTIKSNRYSVEMPALLHCYGQQTVYVLINISDVDYERGEAILSPNIITSKYLAVREVVAEGSRLFLLNPEYYLNETVNGEFIELGVVKPWLKK